MPLIVLMISAQILISFSDLDIGADFDIFSGFDVFSDLDIGADFDIFSGFDVF